MAGTLTVANSSMVLVVADLFPSGVPLQGYAADEVFSAEPATHIETMMGVDGRLSGGWVPSERTVNLSLMGDSDSNFVFEEWAGAQRQRRDALIATLIVTVFAINRVYTCTYGFLRTYSSLPDGRRILQPRRYAITFQAIDGAPA